MTPRWYCVSIDGQAMTCANESDARANAAACDLQWPRLAPHRAVLLGDVAAERERILALVEAVRDANAAASVGAVILPTAAQDAAWLALMSGLWPSVELSGHQRPARKDEK